MTTSAKWLKYLAHRATNSTLSGYMITIFQDRLSGLDYRNPAPWMELSLPSIALDTRFLAGQKNRAYHFSTQSVSLD
jgi:hypothetical protein